MQAGLEKISAVTGVLGAFVASRGEVLLSTMPAFYPRETLTASGGPLVDALAAASAGDLPLTRLTVRVEESLVLIEPLIASIFGKEEQAVLVVVGPYDGSPEPLVQAANESRPTLLEALARLRAPIEAPAAPEAGGTQALAGPGMHGQGGEGLVAQGPSRLEATPASDKADAEEDRFRTPLSLSQEVKAKVVRKLTGFVGPIAPMLVAEALRQVRTGPELLERLALEIEDDEDRRSFTGSLRAQLREERPDEASSHSGRKIT